MEKGFFPVSALSWHNSHELHDWFLEPSVAVTRNA